MIRTTAREAIGPDHVHGEVTGAGVTLGDGLVFLTIRTELGQEVMVPLDDEATEALTHALEAAQGLAPRPPLA